MGDVAEKEEVCPARTTIELPLFAVVVCFHQRHMQYGSREKLRMIFGVYHARTNYKKETTSGIQTLNSLLVKTRNNGCGAFIWLIYQHRQSLDLQLADVRWSCPTCIKPNVTGLPFVKCLRCHIGKVFKNCLPVSEGYDYKRCFNSFFIQDFFF